MVRSISSLPSSTPEAEGIPSAAILRFIEAVEQHERPLDAVHSFMLVRHGHVVAQGWWDPYQPELPHMLYSLSKSFTSSAIGIAVSEGLLRVDDPVLQFFPDDAPEHPGDNLRAMTVRHLLSMNTGHHEDTTNAVWRGGSDNWPRTFLSLPVEHEPGTWFAYNTAATYMLSAIITQLTGETLIDYLRPRLFEPLGIENPSWDTDPQGRSIGGSGLHITTGDIARFGQMYLQRGMWNGQQIVSEAWVAEATAIQSDTRSTQTNPDWTAGYGYQFWRGRHGTYRGDGAFGQFCLVFPEQDAVLAVTSGMQDLQGFLDLVWEHLLPAFEANALPEEREAQAALDARLASLTLPVVQGTATTSANVADTVYGRTYTFDTNDLGIDRVSLEHDGEATSIVVRDASGEHRITAGYGFWQAGVSTMRGKGTEPIAACGAWTDDRTFELRFCYTEAEVGVALRLHVTESGLSLEVTPNVAWDAVSVMTLTGR